MSVRAFVGAALTCLGTAAHAACFGTGTPMFTCTFNSGAKQVNVCLQDAVALYSFGPTQGAPELLMGREAARVELRPWNGIGRSIWEEVRFSSGAFSYTLSYALDRAPDGALPDGRLIVTRGESEVAELICDAGSVDIHDFYPLFEAKEASGQCYDLQSGAWRNC